MNDTFITLSELLAKDLPELMIKSIPGQIKTAYKKAHESAKKPVPDLYYESLNTEQGLWAQCILKELAEKYCGSGLSPRLQPNTKKRSHLEIETDRILMTSHRVRSAGAFTRDALYRESNATFNHLWLDGIDEPHAPENSKCNIYILHGPDQEDRAKLGFVQLAVPDPRQKRYLSIKNLYSSEVVIRAEVEENIPEPLIRLKSKKSKTQRS
ncbi:hypothetical protein [Maridesulfovibrio ferrireducens]|uniref:hypothetical protein n=1 Tax=Maridesulfovibrio ferrireducens TaxID=246191 RepID=UPI001A28DAC0|nr:hypothetical protein [Maridesulfovibrio ferrireducens]MBI9113265.1 hypothetical protein [Maridesulfovibrio ferrireducens]